MCLNTIYLTKTSLRNTDFAIIYTNLQTDLSFVVEMVEVFDALGKLYTDYQRTTPKKLKIVDAYMFYILITGVLQFAYCLLVGTFPFNAFLAGFISTVTCFVLAANLRIQVNPENKAEFPNISPERAFADFVFAHVILHLVVVNFIG